jgi:hypothetical protein
MTRCLIRWISQEDLLLRAPLLSIKVAWSLKSLVEMLLARLRKCKLCKLN